MAACMLRLADHDHVCRCLVFVLTSDYTRRPYALTFMIMMAGIGKHGIRSLATQSVCFAGTSCKAIGPSVAIACALDLSRDPVSVDTSLLTPVSNYCSACDVRAGKHWIINWEGG